MVNIAHLSVKHFTLINIPCRDSYPYAGTHLQKHLHILFLSSSSSGSKGDHLSDYILKLFNNLALAYSLPLQCGSRIFNKIALYLYPKMFVISRKFCWIVWGYPSHSLACPAYCTRGHPFIMVISEDPLHSLAVAKRLTVNCHYLFLRLSSVPTGGRNPISRMRDERPTTKPPWRFMRVSCGGY